MKVLLNLPHRVCDSTCYVNGLEDILQWQGQNYPDYLLSILGGMGEFAYLKFKSAHPPCMVYWGANSKYLMNDLATIIGFQQIIIENRTFKHTFSELKKYIQNGQPIVAGALDMFYLHYYSKIYRRQHIPIHYVLVVGFDNDQEMVWLQDCGYAGVQPVSYQDFEQALNVNVPGMSKKNTIRIFIIPDILPSEFEIAQRGFHFRAKKMLNPPVRMFGIPAMRKLAKEILIWKSKDCFEHLVTYATIPPHIPKTFTQSHGMRFWKAQVLEDLGTKYKINVWMQASEMFNQSGRIIQQLCEAALHQDRTSISNFINQVADIEEKAYRIVIR